jgi:hypothetical protein
MKAYEQHCAENGQPQSVSRLWFAPTESNADVASFRFRRRHILSSHTPIYTNTLRPHYPPHALQHAMAKELLAGFAAAEVDKIFETKGEWDGLPL